MGARSHTPSGRDAVLRGGDQRPRVEEAQAGNAAVRVQPVQNAPAPRVRDKHAAAPYCGRNEITLRRDRDCTHFAACVYDEA
jgi:hypothetical protein